MGYPATRLRRMRRDAFSRALMRETVLTAADLILPVFVHPHAQCTEVSSMPGVQRLSPDALLRTAEAAQQLGVPALALFPAVESGAKSADAREAWNDDGLVQLDREAITLRRYHFPSGTSKIILLDEVRGYRAEPLGWMLQVIVL